MRKNAADVAQLARTVGKGRRPIERLRAAGELLRTLARLSRKHRIQLAAELGAREAHQLIDRVGTDGRVPPEVLRETVELLKVLDPQRVSLVLKRYVPDQDLRSAVDLLLSEIQGQLPADSAAEPKGVSVSPEEEISGNAGPADATEEALQPPAELPRQAPPPPPGPEPAAPASGLLDRLEPPPADFLTETDSYLRVEWDQSESDRQASRRQLETPPPAQPARPAASVSSPGLDALLNQLSQLHGELKRYQALAASTSDLRSLDAAGASRLLESVSRPWMRRRLMASWLRDRRFESGSDVRQVLNTLFSGRSEMTWLVAPLVASGYLDETELDLLLQEWASPARQRLLRVRLRQDSSIQ